MQRSIGLLIVLCLVGCTQAPVKAPAVVRVPVTKYVPVPAELTVEVPIAEPQSKTVAEAVRVARERKAALHRANAQLRAIRKLEVSGP